MKSNADITTEFKSKDYTALNINSNTVWMSGEVNIPNSDEISLENPSRWYRKNLDEFLQSNVTESNVSLYSHIRKGLFKVMNKYSNQGYKIEVEPKHLPRAVITAVRIDEENSRFEYFSIGDYPLFIERKSEGYNDTHRICAVDMSEYKNSFEPQEQRCLSFNPDSLDYARFGQLDLDEIDKFGVITPAVDRSQSLPSEEVINNNNNSNKTDYDSVLEDVERNHSWRDKGGDDIGVIVGSVKENR